MVKKTTKRPKSKKKVKEQGEWEVTTKDTTPGTNTPETSKTVRAASASQAVDSAIDPQSTGDAEEVTVTKKSPTLGAPEPPKISGQQEESKTPKINMKKITESVDYPYTVFLPRQFEQFIESLKLESRQVGHGLMLKFETKNQLTETLRALKKSNNPKAFIIMNGIKESTK